MSESSVMHSKEKNDVQDPNEPQNFDERRTEEAEPKRPPHGDKTARPSERRGNAPTDEERDTQSFTKASGPAETSDAPKIGRKTIVIGIIVAACVLCGGLIYYFLTKNTESTDDAQVTGNAVMIASKVSGRVETILISDNQRVFAGDVLFKIDERDYAAARDKARATLDIAQAQLDNARVNLDMTKVTAPAKLELAKAQKEGAVVAKGLAESNLRRQNALTDLATTAQNKEQASTNDKSAGANVGQSEAQVVISGLVDQLVAQAQAQVDQSAAQVKQAAADLQTAALNLSYTDIRAPYDGWVTQRNTQVGSYVQAGQSMSALVSPDIWIVANFKENQLDRMRVGQKVSIKVDAYPSLQLKGHVDTLQMGTGSVFTAFPAQNATGNFVKIVQRVPVKLVIDSGLDPNLPLPLGLSVVPSVHLK